MNGEAPLPQQPQSAPLPNPPTTPQSNQNSSNASNASNVSSTPSSLNAALEEPRRPDPVPAPQFGQPNSTPSPSQTLAPTLSTQATTAADEVDEVSVPSQLEGSKDNTLPASGDQLSLTWTAAVSAAQRSKSWLAGLLVISILLAIGMYLLTSSIISSVGIVVLSLLVGITYTKNPHSVQYVVDNQGITINQKHYSYNQFKAFSLIEERGFKSVSLQPFKHYWPNFSMYYDPSQEQQVVAVLAARLPLIPYMPDAIDRVTNAIRF
jgi:hypothetical protein